MSPFSAHEDLPEAGGGEDIHPDSPANECQSQDGNPGILTR